MSGSRRSSRITSGGSSAASAIGSPGRLPPRSSGARPRGARPGRASGCSRCRRRSGRADIRGSAASWRRKRHRRILATCPSGSCSPRTSTSSARACGVCSRRETSSRSQRSARTSTRCSTRWMRSGRTSSSRISGCRPGNTDEGIQAATRLRETNPEVGVVVLSQYATPSYVLALLEGGSERPGVPPEGAGQRSRAARRRHPGGRRRRLGHRPEGRGGAGRGERAGRGLAAQRADSARA